MLDIWRGFGRGIGTVIDEIEDMAGKRGLVALAVGAVVGIAITAFFVWIIFAENGCSPELSFWGAVGRGLSALFLGFIAMVFTGFIFGILLYVPDGVAAVADGISEWRYDRKRRREQGLPASSGKGRNWVLFFGTLAIAIISIGFAVGYIAWLLVC